jgi:hypothetical protein
MNLVCAGYIWRLHTHVIVVVNIISPTLYLIGSGDCCVMGGVLEFLNYRKLDVGYNLSGYSIQRQARE